MVCHRSCLQKSSKADDKAVDGAIAQTVEGKTSVQTEAESDAPLVG